MIVKGREFVADILFATLSMWLVVSEADCSAEAPVEYYEYILPNLPNTTYDFNDIVILPRDRDDATVTILNASGELIFDKTTVNIGSDFRLNVTDNNISYTELLAGLRMRTSIECDVVINLSGIPLHLVSTVQFETKHQLISDQQEILEKCMFVSALIQASKQDTVANICQFWARNATVDSNSDAVSRVIPWAINCSQIEIPFSDGLIINNASILWGTEIVSNSPVCVIFATECNLPSLNNRDKHLATFESSPSPIVWKSFSQSHLWSDQFLLMPSPELQIVNLSIIADGNATVTIYASGKQSRWNITYAVSRRVENVPVNRNGVYLVSSVPVNVKCSSRKDGDKCICQDFIAIKIRLGDNVTGNEDLNGMTVRWIHTKLSQLPVIIIVLCASPTNVSLKTGLSGVVNQVEPFTIELTDSQVIYVYRFNVSIPAFYRLEWSSLPNVCQYYVQQTFDESYSFHTTSISNSTYFDKDLYDSKTQNFNQIPYVRTSFTSPSEGAKIKNTTFESSTVGPVIKTVAPSNVGTVTTSRGYVILDTIHSDDGIQLLLNAESGHSVERGQTYTVNLNQEGYEIPHVKNITAVVVSLLVALFAVAGLILIFVLNDFVHRRRRLRRNTRIRPFLSYYD